MKKILTCMLSFMVLAQLLLAPVNAQAATNDKYTYTVKLFAGNQGGFVSSSGISTNGSASISSPQGNGSYIVIQGLHYGDYVSIRPQIFTTVNDNSKYYVRGIRESGLDNDKISNSGFVVGSDRDYVIAYAIAGDMTSYTVKYVDADGNALANDDVFYGKIGDKPVVAFLYVDGYAPRYYNITKTLSNVESENVFTFIYDPIAGPQRSTVNQPEEETTDNQQDVVDNQNDAVVNEENPENVNDEDDNQQDAADNQDAQAVVAPADNANDAVNQDANQNADDNAQNVDNNDNQQPMVNMLDEDTGEESLFDINDELVPQSANDESVIDDSKTPLGALQRAAEEKLGIKAPVFYAIIGVLVFLIAMVVTLIIRKQKRKKISQTNENIRKNS